MFAEVRGPKLHHLLPDSAEMQSSFIRKQDLDFWVKRLSKARVFLVAREKIARGTELIAWYGNRHEV